MDLPPIMKVGGPMPAAMGRCADLYHDVRELRLTMEKEVAEIKARESELREHLINNISKSDDTGAAGLRYRAQIITKDKPRLTDWAAFTSFVKQRDRFDMLQHRLSDKAVMDWLAEGLAPIPGTEIIHVPEVSVTKI